MADEQSGVEAADWREAVAIVLHNWRGEIVEMVRHWRTALGGQPRPAVRLVLSADEALAVFDDDGQAEELGRFARTAAGADALATRLAKADLLRGGHVDVLLAFDDAIILRSQVKLPKVSSAALRGALGFELDRLSPIPSAELYFDFVVRSRDTATNRLEIVTRALRRRAVDDAVKFAQSAGASAAAFQLGGDDDLADWRQFPVDRAALLRGMWQRWGSALLAGLAAVLLLATLLAMSARAAAADDALTARIANEEIRAAAVSRLERKMDIIRSQAAFVVRQKMNPSFVATLAALTKALPAGSWLTDIQFDSGKVHIQGYSHAASDLISQLDRSRYFTGAQFNAPLVRNDADGTERFDLSAGVIGAP